jgi:hypothetical protein
MHVGSWEAGPRVATIASVIESAKRLGINPREYLADVLPRLANGTTSEVPSLTPPPGCATVQANQPLNRSGHRSTEGFPTGTNCRLPTSDVCATDVGAIMDC